MGRTACTEAQCLYKGALFTFTNPWPTLPQYYVAIENRVSKKASNETNWGKVANKRKAVFFEVLQIMFYVYINPYPTAFPYGNGMVLHFYQQQESSTTKTVHKVINKGLKTYV